MELYLLFLIACFSLGIFWDGASTRRIVLAVIGMAVMVSIGVFVFRMV